MEVCDICKAVLGRRHEVLCAVCRETIARLAQICDRNPELLQSPTTPDSQPVSTTKAVGASPSR